MKYKIKALLSKTVANGCTPEEAAAASELAQKLMETRSPRRSKFDWSCCEQKDPAPVNRLEDRITFRVWRPPGNRPGAFAYSRNRLNPCFYTPSDPAPNNNDNQFDVPFQTRMIYQKEPAYQRALRTLEQLAKKRNWDFRPPIFEKSEVKPTVIILRDHHNEIARFRFTYRNRLALVDHAFHVINSNMSSDPL
jgi:hypothetical protein